MSVKSIAVFSFSCSIFSFYAAFFLLLTLSQMKQFIYRIVALLAAMVLGATAQATSSLSLSEQSGETHCLSCAYAKVVLGLSDGQGYDYAAFQKWAAEVYAPSVGMTYDKSGSRNVAILHAKPIEAVEVFSPTVEVERKGSYDIYTTRKDGEVIESVRKLVEVELEVLVADTLVSTTVAVPSSVSADLGEMRASFIRVDVGQSKAVSMYDLWELAQTGNRGDVTKFEYVWRQFVDERGGVHPRTCLAMWLGYEGWLGDGFTEMYDKLEARGRKAAWYGLTNKVEWREMFAKTYGTQLYVLPEYHAGGGSAKPVGNGLSKVSAAKSRQACRKGGSRG